MWPEKANCGNEVLAFFVSAIKEGRRSRRRTLQMQLALKVIKQPTTILEFGFAFYYWLFPKEHQSSSLRSFLSSVSSKFIYFVGT